MFNTVKSYFLFTLIIFIFWNTECISQRPSDSIINTLKEKKLTEIIDLFYQEEDTTISEVYAKYYIKKAKTLKDTFEICRGYELMASNYEQDYRIIPYLDSIISITKTKSYGLYPSVAHYFKGNLYYRKRNFKKALDNYLFADSIATKQEFEVLSYEIKHGLALLKSRLGYIEEALELCKECKIYYDKNNYLKNYNETYLWGLFCISDSYSRLHLLDSASIVNKTGMLEAIKSEDSVMQNYFRFNEGMNHYLKKNYTIAIDSLNKALPELIEADDKPNIAESYFFLGKKSYYYNNKRDKGILYFKKIDSLFTILKDLHPEIREAYEILIRHYKKNKDTKSELYYINRLLKVDSILHGNYKYLSKNIAYKYDRPKLINQKEVIIEKLTNEKTASIKYNWALGIVSLLTSIGLITYYYKQKKYKKRFNNIVLEGKENTNASLKFKKSPITKSNTLEGLSIEVINSVRYKLKGFENNKEFLDSSITLSSLAKLLNTNTNYLSKIINHDKGKNFSSYLNDLRIKYTIEKLKKDTKFMRYSIKGIAYEVGFNNETSFAKAFYKNTGLYPSYFIKQLKSFSKEN